jgi:hypothetical protein
MLDVADLSRLYPHLQGLAPCWDSTLPRAICTARESRCPPDFQLSKDFPRAALARHSRSLPSWASSCAQAKAFAPITLQGLTEQPGWLVSKETAALSELPAPCSPPSRSILPDALAYRFAPSRSRCCHRSPGQFRRRNSSTGAKKV